jgi:cell wall-associated NlpC family hydrolase
VRRTVLALFAGTLALGLIAAGIAVGRGEKPASQAVLRATATPAPSVLPESVPSAGGEVLAEMTRRQGTPARVTREARRRARDRARLRARIAAAERAAQARAAAAHAAARAAAQPSYWVDHAAAATANSQPISPDEAAWLQGGRGGWVEANGMARAPVNAPDAIKRVIAAGNQIARAPYLWGGGHGAWQDKGYDCSGSISYVLAAGGMLGYTQTSGQLMNWGVGGTGRWLTIYANEGHVFMFVAGLRFDTSGRAGDHSSRWQLATRSADGFVARHYPGL